MWEREGEGGGEERGGEGRGDTRGCGTCDRGRQTDQCIMYLPSFAGASKVIVDFS